MLHFVGEQVHRKLASSLSKGDLYETELLEQFTDIEAAGEFFRCLDHQLNKVNQFYKIKEQELAERGESLKQQLDFLIELKNEFKRQRDNKEAYSLDPKDDPSISCHISSGKHQTKSFIVCQPLYFDLVLEEASSVLYSASFISLILHLAPEKDVL
uniref:SPX domain-containing protein n=1 Tax=Opuntia streptacantha TaxID=393608 RepID=A0A7C8YE59_OPUST